ncbi:MULTISPECIES: zinc-binding dehydrogenase [Amycolatopsis]|uniref:NADPH2:quinone reductase n=2 Tax=Amycolatopsis TaxID=1813 RepID=A0A1I3Q0P1_9PSEU|nr:zinc-binding dehydrogenase [Amycolatopsis sacchari]SFJ27021.1 NADPH2:quinone reductase [Amycolatopsis sacchari]
MHLVEADGRGGLRVRHAPPPVPGPGEVLVEVAAAGVRALPGGAGPDSGVAGLVGALGAGVPRHWLGRRVVATVDGDGYAERVTVPLSAVLEVPDAVHEQEAAALLREGSTALALFEAADVSPGESVLVLPAAGGIGSVLVQLAAAAGAHVIGAARGPGKLRLVRDLGADVVVDYGEPGWAERAGYADVVFDGVGGELGRIAFDHAKSRFSAYGTASGSPAVLPEPRGVTVHEPVEPSTVDVQRILRAAADGRVVPLIGQTYPLTRAAEAHAALAARRTVGKTLLVA